MKAIGIRVAPGEVTFAVYDTDSRTVVNLEEIVVPKALTTPESLKYVRSNLLDILREYEIEKAGIRTTEWSAPIGRSGVTVSACLVLALQSGWPAKQVLFAQQATQWPRVPVVCSPGMSAGG